MNYEIQTLSYDGTEYTFAGFRLDPDVDEELQTEGYHSPFTLFVLFNDGQVYAHHTRHEIVKQVSGDHMFIIDSFDVIQAELVD